jgi:hypothetical protein
LSELGNPLRELRHRLRRFPSHLEKRIHNLVIVFSRFSQAFQEILLHRFQVDISALEKPIDPIYQTFDLFISTTHVL